MGAEGGAGGIGTLVAAHHTPPSVEASVGAGDGVGATMGAGGRCSAASSLLRSGTGFEVNLWGLLGFKIGWVEGLEVNVLGLVAGVDFRHPALKLPGYGRLGFDTLLPPQAG